MCIYMCLCIRICVHLHGISDPIFGRKNWRGGFELFVLYKLYVHRHFYIDLSMYIFIHILCIYMCLCICICVHIDACVYISSIHTHVYIYTCAHNLLLLALVLRASFVHNKRKIQHTLSHSVATVSRLLKMIGLFCKKAL